jgi:hypothetical protein
VRPDADAKAGDREIAGPRRQRELVIASLLLCPDRPSRRSQRPLD